MKQKEETITAATGILAEIAVLTKEKEGHELALFAIMEKRNELEAQAITAMQQEQLRAANVSGIPFKLNQKSRYSTLKENLEGAKEFLKTFGRGKKIKEEYACPWASFDSDLRDLCKSDDFLEHINEVLVDDGAPSEAFEMDNPETLINNICVVLERHKINYREWEQIDYPGKNKAKSKKVKS